MAQSAMEGHGPLAKFKGKGISGHVVRPLDPDSEILIVSGAKAPSGHARVLRAEVNASDEVIDLSDGRWLAHPAMNIAGWAADSRAELKAIIESWRGAFSYVQEDPARHILGLRAPQIGALHAIQAHWSISDTPATVVMPTGTGKSEVMLCVLTATPCAAVFVVVPTDALRTQLAAKFLSLGVLKADGSTILAAGARRPVVCTLNHTPRTVSEIDTLFDRANVVITTSHIAGRCGAAIRARIAARSPYLFIDEAHHAEAPTWRVFRESFRKRRILQFTATPFREDGKPLEGEIIYNYPLRQAQKDGYFRQIRFAKVVEFAQNRSDEAIARKGIEQLRADAPKGHILMARVDSVARAHDVFRLYERFPEFNPVELHTGVAGRERDRRRQAIISGKSRIVVCVDMLGEGFDLPELKIAAFHDIRKSLAVTLQIAGRFTRSRTDLGDPTFVANTADVNVQDELRLLYTRDPDWNLLLPELSERMVGEELSLQGFLEGFKEFPEEVPLKTVRPALSTVAYKTDCKDWTPKNFRAGIPNIKACGKVLESTNQAEHTQIIVTARRASLEWTDLESMQTWQWELYVVVWSPHQNLLFINSSCNSGEYRALARAIAGDSASLIQGQQVFRSFAGITRLRLRNVGLTEQLGRNVRYTGRMGSDVEPALSELQLGRARKSVLAGSGYEAGARASVGASRKGRIWAHRRDRVNELVAWCKSIGDKLLDSTIDPDKILRGTLEAKTILIRPAQMPICVDWPEEVYRESEANWSVVLGDQEYSINEVSLALRTQSDTGPLRFAIVSETAEAELELEIVNDAVSPDYRIVARGGLSAKIRRAGSSEADDASDFFYERPPAIWFANGSCLEGNQLVELRDHPRYDARRIITWDWRDTDLRKESQGETHETDSIQARVIREAMSRDYVMVVDDDGPGEIADVLAISRRGEGDAPTAIEVDLYHCKYSKEATAGARIEDLYEVCGQVQKSVDWAFSHEKRTDIFTHLLRRESHRRERERPSRYMRGDQELLLTLREMSRSCPVFLRMFLVQPGLSKSKVSTGQLDLLGVTDNYLKETYQLEFTVITSD